MWCIVSYDTVVSHLGCDPAWKGDRVIILQRLSKKGSERSQKTELSATECSARSLLHRAKFLQKKKEFTVTLTYPTTSNGSTPL